MNTQRNYHGSGWRDWFLHTAVGPIAHARIQRRSSGVRRWRLFVRPPCVARITSASVAGDETGEA